MQREPLLNAIAEYAARHPLESACCVRFAAFVSTHPDCFSRTLQVGHVTGSAFIVDAAFERTLLTHHRKLDIWVQLGGHADGEADVRSVARREAEEESGLEGLEFVEARIFDLDIHAIPARPGEPAHEHFDVRYALRATGNPEFRVSAESKALAWISIAELQTLTQEPSMLRMQAKWLALRGLAGSAALYFH